MDRQPAAIYAGRIDGNQPMPHYISQVRWMKARVDDDPVFKTRIRG
jgi:hypothetical protein